MEKQQLIDGFPDSKREEVSKAILRLRDLGYVTVDLTAESCIVSIPTFMIDAASKIVMPNLVTRQSTKPKEELVPKTYSNKPILITTGEKEINGRVSEYWLCNKKKDKHHISCFIFNKDGLSGRINLGSLFNVDSKISKALKWIDEHYGKNPFLKLELAHNLPEDIRGNRQPIKAITEYLIHEKYLVRLTGSKFQRTGKVHQVDTLDEIKLLHEPSKPAVMNFHGKQAYYTDEEGLYVSLY